MKYQYLNEPIPQEARQELNDKILYLVDQDLAEQSGISREDIYNAYTGDGGLHGLKRSDFANYHEYAEAKKEIENGQFFTPPALCQFIMEALSPAMDETVADLTSGIANFCNFMPLEANFYGCELDIKSHKVAHYLYPAANLEHRDIRFYQPNMRFDYVVGNPVQSEMGDGGWRDHLSDVLLPESGEAAEASGHYGDCGAGVFPGRRIFGRCENFRTGKRFLFLGSGLHSEGCVQISWRG